jgi:DNA-directed RNA polymerase specialized sigma24 family protein
LFAVVARRWSARCCWLSPAERVAYMLREAFDYPYRGISQAIGLTEDNARQLATRGRMSV